MAHVRSNAQASIILVAVELVPISPTQIVVEAVPMFVHRTKFAVVVSALQLVLPRIVITAEMLVAQATIFAVLMVLEVTSAPTRIVLNHVVNVETFVTQINFVVMVNVWMLIVLLLVVHVAMLVIKVRIFVVQMVVEVSSALIPQVSIHAVVVTLLVHSINQLLLPSTLVTVENF